MDMNPQRVRTAQFKTVKRGLDPDEVQAFLASVADELERAQNQSTAMEARARAAVARLQELSDDAASQSDASAETARPSFTDNVAEPVAAESSVDVTVDQSETISRTLLLAQRTADTAVAEAKAEAQRLRDDAAAEAAAAVESSRASAQALVDGAKEEARKAGEDEKVALAGEVNSLMARRDFLESDVDHMEQFLVAQRSRLRDAASEIMELTERVPSGLGESRRPLMSASSDGEGGADPVDAGADAVGAGAAGTDAGPDAVDTDDADGDDLWLPDDLDGDTAGDPADDASGSGDTERSGSTLKFGFPRSND